MADGDGLENHCGGNVTVGSNPTPSAGARKLVLDLGLCRGAGRSAAEFASIIRWVPPMADRWYLLVPSVMGVTLPWLSRQAT